MNMAFAVRSCNFVFRNQILFNMKTTSILKMSFAVLAIAICMALQSQTVTSLTLINSGTDTDIRTLSNASTIDLTTDGALLNVRANVSGTVGSVKFEYDEANIGSNGNVSTATESTAPYTMRGDKTGDYYNWTPSIGTHILKVTAYTEASAGGTAGTPLIISFTVVDGGGGTGGGYTPPADAGTGVATNTGELKKWHKITLSFDGPTYKETDVTPNPFKDYRLNVTFTNGTKSYVVPGYFAADGNAGETSASSGNVWRVHFAPDATGTWNWSASFRIGENIAVSNNAFAGTAVSPIDGKTGSFTVGATDKTGIDLRAKGRLQYVGEHHLRFAETGEYFLKGGTDAPENFLAYEDFDNTPDNGGRLKSWAAHAADWKTGDPSWKSGKGKEIIGAVNYLASEEMNVFSFLTMNINGDDKNVFPYVSSTNYSQFDCSKLDQWEIVFAHGEKMGMYLHFKTQETENELTLDAGATSTNRKLYYRELIARFGHHMALNWNLGEENHDQTDQQRKDMAQYFYDNDPYRHNLVIHTYPGEHTLIYTPLLGTNSKLTGASIQTDWDEVFASTKTWVNNSAAAGKKWVVANDEQGDAKIGVPDDSYIGTPSIHSIRKETLWGNLMAGGAGVEYYFGYSLPHSDLTCQDFRSRDKSWDYVRFALSFFKNNNVPFWQMKESASLVSSGWCLSQEGNVYVVYLKNGGIANLTINTSGTYNVKWYDPRNGGSLQNGSITSISGTGAKSLGNAPSSTTEDWVVLVTNANGINMAPIAKITTDKTSGAAPLAISFNASESTDSDGTIASYAWSFSDGSTASGVTASHTFNTVGTYLATLTVTDNKGAVSTANTNISVTGTTTTCGEFTTMMSKDFPLTGFYLDSYTGQQLLAITPSTSPVTSTTVKAFTGESCTYNVTFHGVGESDGQSKFKIFVNNTKIGEYTLATSSLSYEFGTQFNFTINDVNIVNGDIIKVEGITASADGVEWSRARWLKIEFAPVGGGTGGPITDCEAPFEEKDEIVVVEVESIPAATGWVKETSAIGYTGSGYYTWKGGDKFNTPGSGILEYKIKINSPGTYHFRWHNKITSGTSNTDCNDTWLRIPDADDFFAKNGTSIKYPNGGMFVQSTTIVEGTSANGWMKVYCSGTTDWTWSCRTSDSDPHEIYATFNKAGVYTVQISARSNYHAIDRFVLFKDAKYTVAAATSNSLAETVCKESTVTNYSEDLIELSLYPNPASEYVFISMKEKIEGTISVVNTSGIILLKQNITSNEIKLNVSNWSKGLYILIIASNEQLIKRMILVH